MQAHDRGSSLDMLLGARVRDLRSARGLSQTALAEAIGVSFQQVQKYEKGVNRISAATLVWIAQTLGVPTSLILESIETQGQAPAVIDKRSSDLLFDFNRIRSPRVQAKLAELVKQLAVDGPDAS